MITLHGFGRIFPEGRGETKDLWAQWALEETGLPYWVHALDHTGGELDSEAYGKISPFRQAPVIDDDGFVVAESAAIALYVAEKAGKLIPADLQGRTRVTQWCFAAVATLGATFVCLDFIGMFDTDKAAPKLHEEVPKIASRWLEHVERRLQDRQWIACDEFTVADFMLASVFRYIRKTDLMEPFPKIKEYYERCHARPAWQRTMEAYSKRVSVSIDVVR
jgi:glutathione S-transferase